MNIELFSDYSDKDLIVELSKGKKNQKKHTGTMTNY